VITSHHNQLLKDIRRLHRRREGGRFVAEGEDLVAAAAAAGWTPVVRLRAGIDVEEAALAKVSSLGSGTRELAVYEERWADPAGPVCVASGRCCRFKEYGHTLFLSNLEAEDDQVAATDDERVRLFTIHQAKGLEFDVVFIIMLCDGLFPSARSLESIEGEEEERRLFYVAITRARQELYLSYPLIRLTQGYGGDMMQQRSRFLNEISAELLDEWNLKPFNPYG
jgi:superfamily I DNA/RNA helicase